MNFREVDRKLCLIRDSRLVQVLDPEQKTQANAVCSAAISTTPEG